MLNTKIRQERLKIGWRLEYVANRINVTNQYISNIETCKQKPSYSVLIKLCKLFNVKNWKLNNYLRQLRNQNNNLATK